MHATLPLTLRSGPLGISFTEASGGLPERVVVREADGRRTLLFPPGAMRLDIELADGRRLRTVARPGGVRVFTRNGARQVEFADLAWHDEQGRPVPEYTLSLRHEFYPDGTAFTSACFFACGRPAPDIVRLALVARPDCSDFDEIRWSVPGRPKQVDGALIMAPAERFLPRGEPRVFETGLMPQVGLYMRRAAGPSLYAELFMEGCNTLSGNPADNASEVVWQDDSPTLRWVIQKRPFAPPALCQWRNHWGWAIRPAAATRHKPPLRMFHYFDNYRRYPEPEQVAAIAASGCDVLVMHENWRRDAQNDGMPHDPAGFAALVETLHRHGIRLAVYVRGSEESVVERGADWFDALLQRDFDGLYVDYGGPVHDVTPPDETYNGGRIRFRMHYLKWRALRRRVGSGGILYSHTGPWFSALGLSFVDGYVSGEGERGLLVRGRAEHEYYSMAAVCPGTMWVAAFPEYTSPRMTPFLAATGQYPHSTLGRQFLTSSLVHPPEPGINDRVFHTLWRLWSVMRGERDLAVYHDFNSRAIFPGDPETGHYLMVSKDRRLALLVVGNFTGAARQSVDCRIAWPFDWSGMEIRLLDTGEQRLSAPPEHLSLTGYGVAGVVFTAPDIDSDACLAAWRSPPPPPGALGQAYLAEVAEQRRLREPASDWTRTWLVVAIPPVPEATYEESLLVDLYNNTIEFVKLTADGTIRHVTWIDKRGAVDVSEPASQLYAGDTAPAIELNGLLGPGTHRLALRSFHQGEPFYSFCHATLSPVPEAADPRARRLVFMNEVEADRSRLTFTVNLPG